MVGYTQYPQTGTDGFSAIVFHCTAGVFAQLNVRVKIDFTIGKILKHDQNKLC
jgi:hypothetical protein